MTMARIVTVALLWVLSSGLAAGQANQPPTSAKTRQMWGTKGEAAVEKLLTETLHQLYDAEKRKDLKFIFAHLAQDFAEVAGDGKVYHREDIEAEWPNVAVKDSKVSDYVFKLMTPDAAYLSYNMEVDATFKGQPFPKHFRVTTVWTRQQGRWLIRFEQATVIPEPAKTN